MRGTKLWTESRSPLISGRSRHARSFTHQWLTGAVVAFALVAGGAGLLYLPEGVSDLTLVTLGLAAGTGALLGSGSGVTLARGMGWLRPWVAAATVGVAVSAAAAVASFSFVGR